jgi:hypothetical protein
MTMTGICNSRARRAAVHGILASTLALGALVSISVIPAGATITPGVCADAAGVDCLTATTATGTAAIATVPADISLGTSLVPGSTVTGIAVGATTFTDTAPTSSQSLTLAITDLCVAAGCASGELDFAKLTIVGSSVAVTAASIAPCVSTNNVGTPTAGTSTTTLSGTDSPHGSTLSSVVTLESGSASVGGCWSETGATITAQIPANLSNVSGLKATIQYTLTA